MNVYIYFYCVLKTQHVFVRVVLLCSNIFNMYSFPFAETEFEAYLDLIEPLFDDLNKVFVIWKKSSAMKITTGKNLRIMEPTENNVREEHYNFNFYRMFKDLVIYDPGCHDVLKKFIQQAQLWVIQAQLISWVFYPVSTSSHREEVQLIVHAACFCSETGRNACVSGSNLYHDLYRLVNYLVRYTRICSYSFATMPFLLFNTTVILS